MPLAMWDKEVRTGTAFAVLELERTPGGIREVGVACKPIVEDLLDEVRAA
ncbi:hypothetical protein CCP1ISM_170011 [Azospirillaceae bacterium]